MVVGKACDVNGDGIPDLLLGDPGWEQEKIVPAFWIVSGKDGSVLHTFTLPEEQSSHFVVDGGVDLDADGVPDLVIAAHPLSRERKNGGGLYFVSGKSGTTLHRTPIPGSWGGGDWARLVSDVDQDGISDVGVLDTDSSKNSALLSVYSGRSGASIYELPLGNECGASWGGFIEVGDLDGDGRKDFAVLLDGDSFCTAKVRVYSSRKKTKLWEHRARRVGDRAYCKLLQLSDLDGDGVRELAVSFTENVEVILGKTGDLLYRLESREKPARSTGYGYALSALGDVDGDGFSDFAVSETEVGMFNGSVHAFSGKRGTEIWETCTRGQNELHMFGSMMADLGDVDGDGIFDVIVGCCAADAAQPGLARVISGKSCAILFEFRRGGDELIVTRGRAIVDRPR
jgi:hypothetical protein